jgi:hypothetical protein
MKFRSRFTGQLKLTQHPKGDGKFAIGRATQVQQTEIVDFSDKTVSRFKDSIAAHVKAGMLVPVDGEAREMFPKNKK